MKTYHGSCHCGEVRFEADIDFSQGTIKCNCSICAKLRWWAAIIKPEAFRLLSGAAALGEYRFLTRRDGHLFCRHCGVHTFGTGNAPRIGDFYAVSVSCLDDLDDAAMCAIPVSYLDGRHDIWDRAPAVTAHL
ncbi:MAG TPA: GFA family protein [Telluria sp.]